jgi:hypothetical protein
MWSAKTVLIPGSIVVLLTSCGDDAISPRRDLSSAPSAARAIGSSFSVYPFSATQISVDWSDNVRNESGWEVHRSTTGAAGAFTRLASLPANAVQHTDAGLTAFTEYCYKVRSFRVTGSKTTPAAFSSVACGTTYGAPNAPSNLVAKPWSSSEIDLAWNDNASNEVQMRLERSGSATGPWQTVINLPSNAVAYLDRSRVEEVQWCYRVMAVGSYGESPSNVDCTTPPAGPRNVTATAAASSVNVTWTDASAAEDGYELQRARDDFVFSAIATLPANSSTYTDASVADDTRYWYRVRALKDGGFSHFGGPASAVVASGPPRAPTDVVATPNGSTAAGIGWTSQSPSATGFRIERSTDGQSSWVTAGTVSGAGSGFYDGERTVEREVCYRVYALNGFGESPASNVDCTTPPAAPSNVMATYQEDGSTMVSWTDNSGVETAYDIWTVWCGYDWDGSWACYYWNFYQAEANATGLQLWLGWDEYVAEVYAVSDGGYSDMGTWAGAAAASGSASLARVGTRSPRPVKGVKASVPLGVRSNSLRGKPAPARKVP